MELIGVVVVALLGACVGLLVGLYLQGSKRAQLAEQSAEQHGAAVVLAEQAAHQRAEVLALAEKQHAEVRGHLMTMTAALVERMQLVGAALAAELRQANVEHRNDLRLAVGLPRASVPGEEPPPTRPTTPPPRPAPPPKLDASKRPSTPPRTAAPTRPAPLPKPALPPKPSGSAKPLTAASSRTPAEIPAAPPTPRSAREVTREEVENDPILKAALVVLQPPYGAPPELKERLHRSVAEERRS